MLKSSSRRASKSPIVGAANRLQDFLQSPLMSVGYLISAILCLFSGNTYWAFMFLVSCAYSNPVLLWQIQNQCRALLQHYKLNAVMLMGTVFGLFAGIVLGLAFAEPSHAVFFQNAETFITNSFKGSGVVNAADADPTTSIVALVMNTLRLLFVMYVLFGIVQVFNAVRQGEEWKDLAKTPFFVVLAGTLGDILVGAIVPAATPPA
jgi:succinate dehydrogenase/fumarate reductase cytochrome b subunit